MARPCFGRLLVRTCAILDRQACPHPCREARACHDEPSATISNRAMFATPHRLPLCCAEGGVMFKLAEPLIVIQRKELSWTRS